MPTPTLRDLHIEAPLSNVSIAYTNDGYIADQIFPVVPVQKKSDLYWIFPKDQWFRNETGTRAPGTRAPRIDYTVTTASYLCLMYALARGIPDEVRKNADNPMRPDVEATEFLTDKLVMAQEFRVANMTVGASSSWGSSASVSTTWDLDTSDPIGDVDTIMNNIVKAIGRMPNTMAMSWDVWRKLKNHPDLLDRIRFTRPGTLVTPKDFMDWTGIQKLVVGTAIYNSAAEGGTWSSAYIWGKNVFIGYVAPNPSLLTPSAGYVLEWQNRQIARFREDQERQDVIEATHSTAEVITASDAGAVLSNAVQ
jgi:hypothetical protein